MKLVPLFVALLVFTARAGAELQSPSVDFGRRTLVGGVNTPATARYYSLDDQSQMTVVTEIRPTGSALADPQWATSFEPCQEYRRPRDFPRPAEYLAFYTHVVREARQRDLQVMPHVTVMFSDTPFSPFRDLYRGLDLDRFKREYRAMVHLIVRELQPDTLALLSEPDTHARLTGLRQLNTPPTMVDVINFALAGLERRRTKLGAGSGSWSPSAFAQALAEKTGVDFIGIHVYPITGPMLVNARQMARIAHAHGKRAVIDEAWLYKELSPGGGANVAATAEIFRRDLASFWQPLDRKFITLMLRLAEEERIDLVSFFWSSLFFACLDYTTELDELPSAELTRRHHRAVYAAIQEGRLSEVGRHLQRAAQAP